MSLLALTQFIKKITTETDGPNSESPRVAALAVDKGLSGEAKIDAVANNLAAEGKKEGYDFTADDVKTYIDSLKVQYETNPMMADMIDVWCTTTCHFGTAVGK